MNKITTKRKIPYFEIVTDPLDPDFKPDVITLRFEPKSYNFNSLTKSQLKHCFKIVKKNKK